MASSITRDVTFEVENNFRQICTDELSKALADVSLDVTPEAVKIFRQICTDEMSKELVGIRKEVHDMQRNVVDLQVSVLDALNKVSELKRATPIDGKDRNFNPGSRGTATDLYDSQKEIANLDWKYVQLSSALRADVAELQRKIDELQFAGAKVSDSTGETARAEESVHLLRSDDPLRHRFVPEHLPPEYDHIVKHASVEYGLVADTWDAATLALVKDLPDVMVGGGGTKGAIRMSMVFGCLVLNLFLQIMLLYWLYRHVLLENVASAQHIYQKFHGEAFIRGKFDQEAFHSLGKLRSEICELAISCHLFLYACLFLWVARCTHELNLNLRRKQVVDRLPPLPEGVDPIHMTYEVMANVEGYWKERKREQKIMIVCLNQATRQMLNFLIFGPRCIVCLGMLLMGVAFLSASQSHTDLILNSLAMAFVFDIDELIMRAFLPLNLSNIIARTHIVIPSDEDIYHLGGSQLEWEKAKHAYGRSLITMVLAIIFIIFWFQFLPIIPGYQWDLAAACDGYLEQIRHVGCLPWNLKCFPTG